MHIGAKSVRLPDITQQRNARGGVVDIRLLLYLVLLAAYPHHDLEVQPIRYQVMGSGPQRRSPVPSLGKKRGIPYCTAHLAPNLQAVGLGSSH